LLSYVVTARPTDTGRMVFYRYVGNVNTAIITPLEPQKWYNVTVTPFTDQGLGTTATTFFRTL